MFNDTYKNYSMELSFYNNSQCHNPFNTSSYHFDCYENMTNNICCNMELEKYNVSVEGSKCLSINNYSFLTYVCKSLEKVSKSNTSEYIKYMAAGIVSILLLIMLTYCCCMKRRQDYNRI